MLPSIPAHSCGYVLYESTEIPGAVMKAILQDNTMSTVILAVPIYTPNKQKFPKFPSCFVVLRQDDGY